MAELGEIQQGPDGNPYKLTVNGWRPIDQQELQRLTSGPLGRFASGAFGGETDTLAGGLGKAFDLASIGLGVGAPLAKGAAKLAGRALFKGGGRSGERVQQALVQNAADRAERTRRQLGGSIASDGEEHLLRQFGGDTRATQITAVRQELRSVGAAEVNGVRQSVFDLFTAPADLTEAQLKAIPHAERLVFKFLPGQVQGSKLFLEGIKSDPILRGAVEYELASNRSGLQRAAARAIGLEDDVIFDADAMGQAADVLGEGFEGIADHIGPTRLAGALIDDIAPWLSSNQKRVLQLANKGNAEVTQLAGREVMQIRSRLMRAATDEFRQGRTLVADDINDIVGLLDAQIDKAISPAVKRQWQSLREQWRVFRVLEKPNVVDLDTGNVNFLTARNNLRKEFKGEFGRQSFAGEGQRRNRVSTATSEFMDWVRVSGAFKDAVGDSGTATRLLSVQNLTQPVMTAKKLAARAMIQFEADRLNLP